MKRNAVREKRIIILLFAVALFLVIRLLVLHFNEAKEPKNRMVMGGSFITQAERCKATEDKGRKLSNAVKPSLTNDQGTSNKDNSNGYDGINKDLNTENNKGADTDPNGNDDYNNNADEDISFVGTDTDVETYFRPSQLPVLNNRFFHRNLMNQVDSSGKETDVVIPDELIKTPTDTILNYFSILREAAHWVEGKSAGCGTLGNSTLPYPVAYEFLSDDYQKKLSYDDYLKTFENILHINLIKQRLIPMYGANEDSLRYFVELETIEGTENGNGTFAYYYGFVDLIKENNLYKIYNLEFTAENYLCAPYHGWAYDAEAVVDIEYGGWCSLLKERYPTEQEDYIKRIYFSGTDGNDYLIIFFHLTNDTDIEIAQFRKNENGKWELIKMDPNECIDKKNE
ncbi:MAG TPA: hypothetical protein VHQ24_02710 [Lachnospiraceae bacterium]|nr:hypothetical protein [Lachnospiraceae bacterium]